MLKSGILQAHIYDTCKISGTKVGKGIYCSPNVEVCTAIYMNYLEITDNEGITKKFGLVFQCRVKPNKIKITDRDEYWVINDSKDIRPYGMLLF